MNCWKCGNPVAPGQKFCQACGADQSLSSAPDPDQGGAPDPFQKQQGYTGPVQNQTYSPPPGSGQSLLILIRIFGWVFAAIYAVSALRGLFSVANLVLLMVGELDFLIYYISLNLMNGINLLLGIALVAVCVAIAMKWSPENADAAFLGFAGLCVLKAVIPFFLQSAVHFLGFIYAYPFTEFLTTLFRNVVFAAILFGLSAVNGVIPVIGRTREQIMASAQSLLAAFSEIVGDIQKRIGNRNGANVNMDNNQGYQGPNQGPNYGFNNGSGQYSPERSGQYSPDGSGQYSPDGGGYYPPNSPGPVYAPGGGYRVRLNENRSIILIIVLSILTCGIYNLYFVYTLARDINIACEGDYKHTDGLLMYFALTIVTCGEYAAVWFYSLQERVRENARRYNSYVQNTGLEVILWFVPGVFLCGIGPLIAWYIIIRSTNILCKAYNDYYGL